MFEIKNPKNGSILQVAEFDFHSKMNYYDAKNACKALGDGWRLPTTVEAELIYKELHLKRKGNFDNKGSYRCEKDSYGLYQVIAFRDNGEINGHGEAYDSLIRVVRDFREKVVSDTDNLQKNPKLNIKAEYVKKISDKFSKTVEYRMKESVILNNNKGLPYHYKFDINIRVFIENNDFINSKIVLALTYYAPHPGTGTKLHESYADVMIDNKDVFKLDNEYAYSGLDSYNRLEIYNKILGQESSRAEQIQFNINLTTLLKIVNAEIFEIRFNKKWDYGGRVYEGEIMKLVGFYNALFDNEFKKIELIDFINNEEVDWEKLDYEILSLCKIGKTAEAIELLQSKAKFNQEMSHLLDYEKAKKYVLEWQNTMLNNEKNQITKESKNKSDSKCFIITATMNDPYHPIVDEFRAYRDRELLTNFMGKAFVSFYYKVGPFAAFVIRKSFILRKLSFSLFVNPVYKRIKNDYTRKQE